MDLFDVQDVFASTVSAVLSAQTTLDSQLTPRYIMSCTRTDERLLHFFRKVDIRLEYRFDETDHAKILFFFSGGDRHTIHTHLLDFSIFAAPSPPVPPASTHTEGSGTETISQPDFLVLPEDGEQVLSSVASLFQAGSVQEEFTQPPPRPVDYESESGEITKPTDPRNPGRGTLVFRLSDGSPAYLVVRVTGKHEADGIYLFDPAANLVRIYSFPSVSQNSIHYTPLHRFALAVRRSLSGAPALKREIAGNQIGVLLDLRNFAGQLRSGYVTAWDRLAAMQSDGPLPSFFDLSDADAIVRYSVAYDETHNVPRLDLTNRTGTTSGQESDPLRTVEGSASIHITRAGSRERVSIDIQTPGFVLSGDKLTQFLGLARVEGMPERIAQLLAPHDTSLQEAYVDLVHSRSDVVALHAYKNSQPTGDFLVIWHGDLGGHDRDFAFTCKVENGALTPQKAVLAMDQDTDGVAVADVDPEVDLQNNEYIAFHNMFHAIRIWQSIMTSTRDTDA